MQAPLHSNVTFFYTYIIDNLTNIVVQSIITISAKAFASDSSSVQEVSSSTKAKKQALEFYLSMGFKNFAEFMEGYLVIDFVSWLSNVFNLLLCLDPGQPRLRDTLILPRKDQHLRLRK